MYLKIRLVSKTALLTLQTMAVASEDRIQNNFFANFPVDTRSWSFNDLLSIDDVNSEYAIQDILEELRQEAVDEETVDEDDTFDCITNIKKPGMYFILCNKNKILKTSIH